MVTQPTIWLQVWLADAVMSNLPGEYEINPAFLPTKPSVYQSNMIKYLENFC
ncbi:MAG: hypothetical protein WC091_05720 [Sulfuricellaceae bacterium]